MKMRRKFPYWTWGKIMDVLTEDGLPTNREKLRTLETDGKIPIWFRAGGNNDGWRVARNQEEALLTLKAVWAAQFGPEEAEKYYGKLKNRFNNSGNQ